MAAPASAYKDRQFLAVIGDEVSSCDWHWEALLTINAGLGNWIAAGWHWCKNSGQRAYILYMVLTMV